MEEREVYMTVGKQISELRQQAGLTQMEIAKKVGVKQGFICSVEKGEKVSLSRLRQILDVLGYDFTLREKKRCAV